MATGKDSKSPRSRKTAEEPRDTRRDSDASEPRKARKKPESQSGTAEDLFWGGSNDQGEVQ